MTISISIIEKVREVRELERELEMAQTEVELEIGKLMPVPDYLISDYHIVTEPRGVRRDNGVFHSQNRFFESSDLEGGTFYFPIEKSEKFLAVEYIS